MTTIILMMIFYRANIYVKKVSIPHDPSASLTVLPISEKEEFERAKNKHLKFVGIAIGVLGLLRGIYNYSQKHSLLFDYKSFIFILKSQFGK